MKSQSALLWRLKGTKIKTKFRISCFLFSEVHSTENSIAFIEPFLLSLFLVVLVLVSVLVQRFAGLQTQCFKILLFIFSFVLFFLIFFCDIAQRSPVWGEDLTAHSGAKQSQAGQTPLQ